MSTSRSVIQANYHHGIISRARERMDEEDGEEERDESWAFQDADEGDNPPFGALRPGWAADIVGLAGDLEAAQHPVAEFARMVHWEGGVRLVVKAGAVYRWDG